LNTTPNVTVEPKVVAGLNRGGEDLFLVLTAEVNGSEVPTELGDAVWGELNTGGCSVLPTDEAAVEADEVQYLTNGEHKFRTYHHEHTWTGTPEQALELTEYDHNTELRTALREVLLRPGNWFFCHRPGEEPRLRASYECYLDGNAD
jgi:hypothetical protein